MGCVGNKKVQKDYRPEDNRQQNQGRPNNSNLNVPGNRPTTSILVDTGTTTYIQKEEALLLPDIHHRM